MDRGPKCQRCWAYEEELDALRGIEVVLRLKYEDVEKLKQELERVTQEKEQLQTEVNAVKITLKKKDEQLSRSASVARKLEDNIAALRLENGNMLTTLHEAFRTRISKIDQVKTSTVVAAEKIKARPVARKPHVIDISEPEKNDQRIHNNDKDSRNAPVKTNKAKIYQPNLAPAAPPYPYGKQRKISVPENNDQRIQDNGKDSGNIPSKTNEAKNYQPDLVAVPAVQAYASGKRRKICLWDPPGEKLCSQVFHSADQLGNHIRHFHIKDLKDTDISCHWQGCPLHGNKYTRKRGLKNHLILHTGEQPYRCHHVGCSRVFSQKYMLDRHFYSHTRQKNFSCSYPGCGKSFSRGDRLSQHKKLAHCIFQCNYINCGKSFTSSGAFRTHRLAHSDTHFPCNYPGCKRVYISNSHLEKHYVEHCKGKLFPCPKCDKMFSSIVNLQRHQVVHPAAMGFLSNLEDKPSYSNSVEFLAAERGQDAQVNTLFDSSDSSDSSDTGDSSEETAFKLAKRLGISDAFSYQMVNLMPQMGEPTHISREEMFLSQTVL